MAKHFLNIHNESIKTFLEGINQNTQFKDLFWQESLSLFNTILDGLKHEMLAPAIYEDFWS